MRSSLKPSSFKLWRKSSYQPKKTLKNLKNAKKSEISPTKTT